MRIVINFSQLVLTGLLFLGATSVLAYPEYIEISRETPILGQPSFDRGDYELGRLHPGHKAEIISINTNHEKGVSFQVRITEGPKKGQLGWIYLSSDEAQRTLKLFDRQNNPINLPSVSGDVKSFKESFSGLSRSLTPTSTKGIASKIPELVTVKNDDQLWKDFIDGKLSLSEQKSENDRGLITLQAAVPNRLGDIDFRQYHTRPTPRAVAAMTEKMEKAVESAGEADCEEETPTERVLSAKSENKWLDGCEVLADQISEKDKTKLEKCFASIKDVLSEGKRLSPDDRDKVFPEFYTKLNPIEQEFMASMVTSIGEAGVLAPPAEEMVAIMMVLKNRRDQAREKGFSDANMLDAALQNMQFSMYNKGAHHWSDALNRPNSDNQTQYAFDAFIKFKNLKLPSSSPLKDIFHYHTDKVAPAWKSARNMLKVVLNGVKLKESGARHLFYKDIGWTFKHNPWSRK